MGCDWAGGTPWCQKLTCKNSLLPPLFSSVFTVSPLPVLLHHTPHLSPSLPLCLCIPDPPSHFLNSFPSLSFCVSLVILHCPTCTVVVQHLQSELCTQAHIYRLSLTHTEGDTRPPLPPAPLPLSHLSAADTKHSPTPGVPVPHRETLLHRTTSKQYSELM